MRKFLLPENCNFYKANLHSHSDWSDGSYSIEEIKKIYKENGYSVYSYTDHNGLFEHSELNDENFLTLPGFEIDFNMKHGDDYSDTETAHFCAYPRDAKNFTQPGLDVNYRYEKMRWSVDEEKRAKMRPDGKAFDRVYTVANINACLKKLRDKGFIVTYNHPCWSVENYPKYIGYTEFDNLEIYNHSCFVAGYDDDTSHVYDDFLRAGRMIKCVAADDNHNSGDMCGGFTMFCAPELTHKAIINAFDKGDFYCSSGPEITALYVEDGKIHIKTKKAYDFIRLVTGHRRAGIAYNTDTASFNICPTCKYVRLEVVDGYKKAYTNAYPVNVLLGE